MMGILLNLWGDGVKSVELPVKMKGWNKTQVRGKMDEAVKSVELAQLLPVHIMSLQI